MGWAVIILTKRMGEPTITYGLLLFLVLPGRTSAREFKGTKTCGHAMIGKGTPLKTSIFEHIS